MNKNEQLSYQLRLNAAKMSQCRKLIIGDEFYKKIIESVLVGKVTCIPRRNE